MQFAYAVEAFGGCLTMEMKVQLADHLLSFLGECLQVSSTDVTSHGTITDAWQTYCETKHVSLRAVEYLNPDALTKMLTHRFECTERYAEWKCKVVGIH